jgi:hypothetical protein
VNLKGQFLDAHSPLSDLSLLEQMGWRSVCALSPPYALVLTGSATTPAFLCERIGRFQHSCDSPDDWFKL